MRPGDAEQLQVLGAEAIGLARHRAEAADAGAVAQLERKADVAVHRPGTEQLELAVDRDRPPASAQMRRRRVARHVHAERLADRKRGAGLEFGERVTGGLDHPVLALLEVEPADHAPCYRAVAGRARSSTASVASEKLWNGRSASFARSGMAELPIAMRSIGRPP